MLPCATRYRYLQRFLLLQEATRRLPRKGKGLGEPVQTQVLFFLSFGVCGVTTHLLYDVCLLSVYAFHGLTLIFTMST